MLKGFIALAALALLAVCVSADVYMHTPRGSNNRLNEANRDRNNDNRMFDSQNNNRGGSNVGSTYFYTGSVMNIEWTNQHSCGSPNCGCEIVLQYMCDDLLRDGTTTDTITENSDKNVKFGRHESWAWYSEGCKYRSRNKGLFTANRRLNGAGAIYTRQNENGDRFGYECPEERDYYPYWRPTPWRDMAYLTDHVEHCDWIRGESQNNNFKYKCYDSTNTPPTATILSKVTKDSCSDAGGTWIQHKWGLPAPECKQVGWGRSNHLGNGDRGLQMLNYNWTVPSVDTLVATGASTYGAGQFVKCVVRTRYNISTDDYDPWNTNSTYNGNNSPVRNNPTVDVGADLQGLKLAMNTNQFGRTFQDRSHSFYIRRLPPSITPGTRIINLNVRGKRGNIVQTYPAHEYDFQPTRFHVKAATDLIHLQWTGSNTHNNGGDAGDGQGGDAGEGTDGTDRHNFVQISDLDTNLPLPLDKYQATSFFTNLNCYRVDGTAIGVTANGQLNKDCAIWLATSGYYRSVTAVQGFAGNNDVLSVTLDNAPPSLIGGVILKSNTPGSYNYISTRNNNFSNRSQKATIVVDPVPVTP